VHPPLAYFAGDAGFDTAALRRQDAAEFERLYQTCAPELGRYLARLCGDADLAQDLVQETFVKAYQGLPHTRPDLQPRPWLYKIATNTARSAVRRAGWKRVLPFGDHPPERPPPDQILLDNRYAETNLVERSLAAIKPDYAAPLLLHWREGFSIDEICAILGISRDNFKKRLYRAKKAFSTAYAQECARSEEGGSR
jgi:RNA polymerase sigma-70 factor (ECF subfamily)